MWMAQRDIQQVLADPRTPPDLRQRLELAEKVRAFAQELGLEVSEQYTSYLTWPGDRILTTLVVTRPPSIDAVPFRFPIVGSVPYKGFFARKKAEAEAEEYRKDGYDICLRPVSAYSTLGYFDDPLTDPMLKREDGRLIEMLLHEFVHATVFLKSRPAFNEGVAEFIGQEGSVLFLAGDPEASRRRRQQIEDDEMLNSLLLRFRSQLRDLYANSPDESSRLEKRMRAEAAAREAIGELPLRTRDAHSLARSLPLGDACLALLDTYWSQQGRLKTLLESLDGNLVALIARLRIAAEAEDPEAHFWSLRDLD
jgi:predicted aminopeptidase